MHQEKFFDFSYECWAAVLCQQVAQSLSVICACLPILHPFIIGLLSQAIEPEVVPYSRRPGSHMRKPLYASNTDFASSRSSHASMSPLTRQRSDSYCRPLATWGLDHISIHRHSHSTLRLHQNVAKAVFTPRPPENVFNRLIEVPQSRPPTSTSATDPLCKVQRQQVRRADTMRSIKDMGVIPAIDWDTDSSTSGGSRKDNPTRNPTPEYVFNRQKVISVSEESHVYDDESKKFLPPTTPKVLRKPPRAF